MARTRKNETYDQMVARYRKTLEMIFMRHTKGIVSLVTMVSSHLPLKDSLIIPLVATPVKEKA
jgi:hypothetical protein